MPEGDDIAVFRCGLEVSKQPWKLAAAVLFRSERNDIVLAGGTPAGRTAIAKASLASSQQPPTLGQWEFGAATDGIEDKPLGLFFMGYFFLNEVLKHFGGNPEDAGT